jgi:dTMP kinase
MITNQGKLIVFEGISGTGKETQAKLLKEYLNSKGIIAHIVYHPTPDLKNILTSWRQTRKIGHITEIYLLLADRSDRVRQVINPAREKGEWIISLRNSLSALVYQAQNSRERLWTAKQFARFEPLPDHLFFFDIPPRDALVRIKARCTHTGEPLGKFETLAYLTQKSDAYRRVLKTTDHISLDANRPIRSIHEVIVTAVRD